MFGRLRIFLFIVFITVICSCKKHVKQIPIVDFFKTPEKIFFKISPDGKYVSYLKPYKDKQNLFIQSLADGKERMATAFDDYSIRSDYFWTYNDQLVFSQELIDLDRYKMYAIDLTTF